MILSLLITFVAGYVLIALESKVKFNKAAVALLMCGVLWTLLAVFGDDADIDSQLIESLGDTAEILVFIIGAMAIVNLIDSYGGFAVITRHIATRNRRKLLWLLSFLTFFISSALDNMATAIIMVVLLNRLIRDKNERWVFAGVVIIAANCGGVWSPIGDITTIMLWMRGNVTSMPLVVTLFLPCIVSVVISTLLATRYISREDIAVESEDSAEELTSVRYSRLVLILGVMSMLFVPIFKSITNLPPFMGMMISLGAMWIITEGIFDKSRRVKVRVENRVAMVLKNVDFTTILFFLGIVMSVSALQTAGVLSYAAEFLDKNLHEVFITTGVIGILSSVIDNVPLVAAAIEMYPLADSASIAASADPSFARAFVQDGLFWHLLAYCAGVGGNLLIIGSAAGVVTMGLEKMNFMWYVKNISLLALAGYLSGIVVLYIGDLIGLF